MIWDTFLFYDEVDMLECRLTELDEVVDRFVLCEGDTTNSGDPKPSYFLEHEERFAPWADRLVRVWATDLPPGGWVCEARKREWIRKGLRGARPGDLVMLSDVDEIPHPENVRACNPDSFVRFESSLYCFAVDWLHPEKWVGTIAGRYGTLGSSMQAIRELRHPQAGYLPSMSGNWHFSWVGGTEANWRKFNSAHDGDGQDQAIRTGLLNGNSFLREGFHVTGVKLTPVTVDETWPRYIYERRCPPEWFREQEVAA